MPKHSNQQIHHESEKLNGQDILEEPSLIERMLLAKCEASGILHDVMPLGDPEMCWLIHRELGALLGWVYSTELAELPADNFLRRAGGDPSPTNS
jgi:hypothetical protein